MRKTIITVATGLALAATPALGQGRGGGGGHGGGAGGGAGGPGGGMGAGPPIAPPGQSRDGTSARDGAHDIAAQRGEFGRAFAQGRHMSAADHQALAQERRATAMQYAEAARAGRKLPDSAARDIRNALKADIDEWRDQFRVGRDAWQAMRDQWIADKDSLTPEQWAQRRADWFTARDAWIAQHRDNVRDRNDTRRDDRDHRHDRDNDGDDDSND